MSEAHLALWNRWNEGGGPRYPQERVVQFTFRRFPAERRAGVRALDLGCGSGVNTRFLAENGFAVTGCDLSAVGLENTRQLLARAGLTATLHRCSADDTGLPAASFDLLICIGVLSCVPSDVARGAVREAERVLAPGAPGMFLFATDRDFRLTDGNVCKQRGSTRAEVEELFAGRFRRVFIDLTTTTFEGGRLEQSDWLVTVER